MLYKTLQISLLSLLATCLSHANLLTNGGFELGAAGIQSNLILSPDLRPEGNYFVGLDPHAYHNLWSSIGDHPSGTGNMMFVNGSTNADQLVWGQSGIAVTTDTYYLFSFWAASVFDANPAQFQVKINGVQVGSTYAIPAPVGQWSQAVVLWNSGASTTASLGLFDLNTAPGGNDFALDDLSFDRSFANQSASIVPEPGSLLLVGGALCALYGSRRRAVEL